MEANLSATNTKPAKEIDAPKIDVTKDEKTTSADVSVSSLTSSMGALSLSEAKSAETKTETVNKPPLPPSTTPPSSSGRRTSERRGQDKRVGIAHDDEMLKHEKRGHPEQPARVRAILNLLKGKGLYKRCVRVPARLASEEDILRVHSRRMYDLVVATGEAAQEDVVHLDGGDTFLNKYTTNAALMAAGTVIACAEEVVAGRLDSAFAFVRPPGHHAEADTSMGFCIFNSTAVAAQYARAVLGLERVAILDWDVHHGNGTQEIFEKDPNVLFLSVHKGGNFYPGTGKAHEVGKEEGKGFTVNCPFLMSGMDDGDYLTLFKFVFLPILKEFNPNLLIVSAGFDCAAGDILGPMDVSRHGFSHMLHYMLEAAPGRVVCALEGGYELHCTARGAQACIETLLGEPLPQYSNPKATMPSADGLRDILECIKSHKPYWKCLRDLDNNSEWKKITSSDLKSKVPKSEE